MTFALVIYIVTMANGAPRDETYVVDYNLSESDCVNEGLKATKGRDNWQAVCIAEKDVRK